MRAPRRRLRRITVATLLTGALGASSLACTEQPAPEDRSTPTPPTTGSPLERRAECSHPADVLDLTNWELTLPTGSSDEPTEITQPELDTYTVEPWFTVDRGCEGVRFRAPVDGATTEGSDYPRSELREMTDDGQSEAEWPTTSGTHSMVLTAAVTHLPEDKPEVVVGQIHGDDSDVTTLRLEGQRMYVTKGDDTHHALAADGYRLGTRFEVRFVAEDGQIAVYYDGSRVTTIDKEIEEAYFKAGVYTQANCNNSSPCDDANYGEAVVYDLRVD